MNEFLLEKLVYMIGQDSLPLKNILELYLLIFSIEQRGQPARQGCVAGITQV